MNKHRSFIVSGFSNRSIATDNYHDYFGVLFSKNQYWFLGSLKIPKISSNKECAAIPGIYKNFLNSHIGKYATVSIQLNKPSDKVRDRFLDWFFFKHWDSVVLDPKNVYYFLDTGRKLSDTVTFIGNIRIP